MKNWFINHIWKLLGINRLLYYQNEQQKKLDEIAITNKEILKAFMFNDSIKDCEWLKYKSFSAGEWAIDYGCLYTLFRVLNDIHPKSILEFGLGQSSKLIHQYADYYADATAITYEHDENWIEFFCKGKTGDYKVNINKTELQSIEYKGETTLSYKDNCEELIGKKFDFIMIDAPFGSARYSRSQILNIVPACLADSFCIIMDDFNRKGEQETVAELQNILQSNGIETIKAVYTASKDHCLICSKDLKFLASL